MEIISREDARSKGYTRFYTGEPCKRGHIAERTVSSNGCLMCTRENNSKYWATGTIRDSRRNYRIKHNFKFVLRQEYGMSQEEYLDMLKQQENRCAICNIPLVGKNKAKDAPAVDHCHTSTAIRGILCTACNKGLGFFRDNPEFLLNAANYLTQTGN
jgi:hypothetical protein